MQLLTAIAAVVAQASASGGAGVDGLRVARAEALLLRYRHGRC
jgi:hypothetical protein